jgi:hypothetical protein
VVDKHHKTTLLIFIDQNNMHTTNENKAHDAAEIYVLKLSTASYKEMISKKVC